MGSFPSMPKLFSTVTFLKFCLRANDIHYLLQVDGLAEFLFRVTYFHDIVWSIFFSFTMALMRLWVTLKVFCSKLYNFCLEASNCKGMELSTSPTLAEELLEAKKGKGNLLSSYAPEKVVCASVDGPTLMCVRVRPIRLSWWGIGNLKRIGALGDMLWAWVVQETREARVWGVYD